MIRFVCISLLFLLPFFLSANVWVYPNPGEPVKNSPLYRLNVIQEDRVYESFVYYSQATFNDLERSSSWTTFSFSGEIIVEVEVLNTNINKCVLRPKSKNIAFEQIGNTIRFKLNKPQKLALEVNDDKKNPLFIFADPPEENIPAKGDKGLWYFEPGVHAIGKIELPDTVIHIYVAGGAYVQGAFENTHRAGNFKLSGRGIITSEIFEKINDQQRKKLADWQEQNPHTVYLQGNGKNVYVEGITFADGVMNNLIVNQSYSTVRNCKFFGWYFNTDGVLIGEHGLIENCFFRCNDDAIKLYKNYLVVQNCIFWQNDNGAPFQISWNSKENYHHIRALNCDVIHCEHKEESYNGAIFSAVHGGEGHLSDYHFENIRIEGDVFRLFKLTIRTNAFDNDPGFGNLSNVYFKNISLEGKCEMANEIWGYNVDHKISNVIFENLQINGKRVRNMDEGNFKINFNTTENIQFW